MSSSKPAILLVDDSPADLDLIREGLAGGNYESDIHVVPDGEEAIAFVRNTGRYVNAARPDLMILDLNLPRKDGRAVLASFKSEPGLRTIPVVIFTTSRSRQDVAQCYELGANCYVTKPGGLQDFLKTVQSIERFWLGVATTPE